MSWIVVAFVKVTGYLIQLFYFKRKTYYVNSKVQKKRLKGRAVIISNHTGLRDFCLYMFLFFWRNFRFLAAELLYRKKRMSWFLKKLGAIKVNRDLHEVDFVSKSVEVLNKEKALLIFPEARISQTKEILPFTSSFIYIAIKGKAPIIPVYTDGNYGFFKRTHVLIGEPIYLEDYCNNSSPTKEEIAYLTNLVRDRIIEMEAILKARLSKGKQK